MFTKDETLFRTGDEGDYFYIVLEGKIDLHLPNPVFKKCQLEIATLDRFHLKLQSELAELRQRAVKSSILLT